MCGLDGSKVTKTKRSAKPTVSILIAFVRQIVYSGIESKVLFGLLQVIPHLLIGSAFELCSIGFR